MTTADPSTLRPGERLAGRYELIEVLEKGHFACLYLANDPQLERHVAVKVFDLGQSPDLDRDAFLAEAQVLAQLQHPSLIPVFDYGRLDTRFFFVQPPPRGRPLAHWLRGQETTAASLEDPSLEVQELLAVGVRLAEVLGFLASYELLHRDISPSTVRVAREGGDVRVWLQDFCLPSFLSMRLAEDAVDGWPTACRTPEFRRHGSADAASDVYTLGVLLYSALTGQPARRLLDRVTASGNVAPLPAAGWSEDPALEELVASCLQGDPARRPTPRELEAGLERCRLRAVEGSYESQDSLRRSRHGLTVDVASLRGGRSRLQGRGSAPADAPFVGRRRVMRRLVQILQQSLGGECHWVLVGGERGIGKSRLMQELAGAAQRRGVRVLSGHCLQQNESFPHDGFCGLVQDHFRQGGDSALDDETSSASGWNDVAPDLLTLFPALEGVPELRRATLQEGKSHSTFDSADPTHVYELLARTLVRLAAGAPLVVILESLHRSPASVEALSFIHYRLRLAPVLLLCSFVDAELSTDHPLLAIRRDVADDPRAQEIHLEALEPAEHARLSAHWSGVETLPAPIAMRLYEATDGNPFFTRELVRSLMEDEPELHLESGKRSGSFELDFLRLPETVQQAVASRLQSLPEAASRLISTAAVLGRRFDADDLLALVKDPEEAEDQLDDLLRRGLLQEDDGGPGDQLSFVSSVVRDVLYQQLPRRRRRLLHRRYAELLESRHGRHLERVYPLLVHHFSAADEGTRTVTYALMLARRFDDVASAPDIVRATQAALEFLADETWEGAKEDSGEVEGELRELLAGALRRQGSTSRALAAASRSVSAFQRAGERRSAARVAHFAAETAWHGRRIGDVDRWLRQGLELATSASARDLQRQLLLLQAMVANLRGDHGLARESLQRADGLQAVDGVAEVNPPDSAPSASREAEPGGLDDRRPSTDRSAGDQDSTGSTSAGSASAGSTSAGSTSAGSTLITVLPHPVTSVDPMDFGTAENLEVLANVFECLVKSDGAGHWLPGLATDWQIEDGGRRVVFELRRGVVFSGGEPFDAWSVVRSWQRAVRWGGRRPATALASIRGFEDLRDGRTEKLSGFTVLDSHRLQVELTQALPIFPALVSDLRTAIVFQVGESLQGTGPFFLHQTTPQAAVLRRNERYWRRPPIVRQLEFRTHYDAAGIAAAWRQGQLDLARDLAPQDLEDMLRRPKRRGQFVETPRSNVYYVAFNGSRGPLADANLRRALCVAIGVEDMVWSTLGRLARPAAGWLPPGILGHDEQARAPRGGLAQAETLLQQSGVSRPLTLRAMVHPRWQDRYGELTRSLVETWGRLGIEVQRVETSLDAAYARYEDVADIDLLFDRWLADVEDPDDFTYSLFSTQGGLLRRYMPADGGGEAWQQLMATARREPSPIERQKLYHQWQRQLRQAAWVLPVFHDIDYRLASLRLQDVSLRSVAPFVDYLKVSKRRGAAGRIAVGDGASWRQQTLRVAMTESFGGLDPILAYRVEVGEVSPCLFETLTRIRDGAHVVPWLAERIVSEDGDRRFRIHLRRGIRLHDGQPLTAHHVVASLRRLLRLGRNALAHFALSPLRAAALRGLSASGVFEGSGAEQHPEGVDGVDPLAEEDGLRVISSHELVCELEHPTPSFAARLACPTTAIAVLSGASPMETRSAQTRSAQTLEAEMSSEDLQMEAHGIDLLGTGPFRLRRRGTQQLDLEASPHYWRRGLPRCDRLIFEFGVTPEMQRQELQNGNVDIIGNLPAHDLEELRQMPGLKATGTEAPRFSTCFVAFNCRQGPLADPLRRAALVRALDLNSWLGTALGRLGQPARGLIPPGMPGSAGDDPRQEYDVQPGRLHGLTLRLGVHPSIPRRYNAVWRRLQHIFQGLDIVLEPVECRTSEVLAVDAAQRLDLVLGRWITLFPDTDAFLAVFSAFSGQLFEDREVTALIDQGRRTASPKTRHELYRDVERRLLERLLVLPLFHEQTHRMVRSDVVGVHLGFGWPEVPYEDLRRS